MNEKFHVAFYLYFKEIVHMDYEQHMWYEGATAHMLYELPPRNLLVSSSELEQSHYINNYL